MLPRDWYVRPNGLIDVDQIDQYISQVEKYFSKEHQQFDTHHKRTSLADEGQSSKIILHRLCKMTLSLPLFVLALFTGSVPFS